MLPSVAVVILNWNGKKFLEQFLPSVLASGYGNLHVVMADNASTDDSVAFVEEKFPTVSILCCNENLGFAGGYNYFLRQVQADYYVLLNSDVSVMPGWIDPIIQLMENDSAIAACQPKILSWHQPNSFEYAGAAGGWIDSLGYPFARGRVFDQHETDHGQYNNAAPIFWATGAAMFVRASAFHAVGGFDASFFAHQEEIDLCWRLQRRGYKIYVCPSSVVYHVGGGALPKGSARKVFLNFRNNLIMLYKNLPLSQAVWKIPLRLLLDQLSACKELLGGELGYFGAVWKAHLAFLIWCLKKGQRWKAPYPPLSGYYHGSVVWQYFIKKKTAFSEILPLNSSKN